MNEKIKMQNEQISECEKLINDKNNYNDKATFIRFITRLYKPYIKDIEYGLDSCSHVIRSTDYTKSIDYKNDLQLIQMKLEAYKAVILDEIASKENDRITQIEVAKYHKINISATSLASSEASSFLQLDININTII